MGYNGIYIYIYTMGFWLVVWNMVFIFPYLGNVIIPTDFHIFQRVETTNQGMFGRDAINRDLFDAGKFDQDRFGRDKFDGAKFDRDYRKVLYRD